MKLNLKATKGSFGEYGRVRRGTILRNLSEERAKKLIASGAYAVATDAELKAADETKIIDGLAPVQSEKPAPDVDISKMKIDQLKAFAKDKGIDLGEASKRDEIIARIEEALTVPDA